LRQNAAIISARIEKPWPQRGAKGAKEKIL
jgi:hypothetical protein